MQLDATKGIKRLAIYFFFDKDGVVDDYVTVFLDEIKKHTTELCVVCNGFLQPEGYEKLNRYANHLIIRENIGFDVWAYKAGLEHYGWNELVRYDEVILANFTIMGPIYPFDDMFHEMNQRDLDFWGITKHYSVLHDSFHICKYGYIPEHIQSSFLVLRKPLLGSVEYKQLWDKMPMIHSYAESVGLYEAIFTKDFEEKGFRSGVYVNTDDLEGFTCYPLMRMSYQLVKNRKCPVIKRKAFSQNYYDVIAETLGYDTIDTFEYIDKHTKYDVNLIWDNIIRTFYMADIKTLMHLNYILPKEHSFLPAEQENHKQVALFMHIYFDDLVDYCLDYAKSMPDHADLYITYSSDKTLKALNEKIPASGLNLRKIQCLRVENVGRDVSALLVGCYPYVFQYDYVCFAHDKKTQQVTPFCNGESFSYKCFENCLGSPAYVHNILTTFDRNPRLGMLMPPPPNHGAYFWITGSEWANNYENTRALANKLEIHCPTDWTKEPISPLGTMFWFRPKALKILFDQGWKYEDFPKEPNGMDGSLLHAIERVYGLVVQHEGYYPAWVMSDKFARIEFTNMHFYLREMNQALLSKYYTSNLFDTVSSIRNYYYPTFARLKRWVKKRCPTSVWRFLKKMKRSNAAEAS